MKFTTDTERREAFSQRLRGELARLDFYWPRGDRYLIAEFCRWAAKEKGVDLDEVSMGRYLRRPNPVLPTPDVCRELARALGRESLQLLCWAGYVTAADIRELERNGRYTDRLEQLVREIG